MAHKYSNFTDAFTSLKSRTALWYNQYGVIADMCDDARDYADAENYKLGIYKIAQALQYFTDVYDRLIDLYFGDADESDLFESLYWSAQSGGDTEIDMSDILNAVWDANPAQCLLFIPMIDAMRGSIQNKTVTTQYMADALKHFMT